MRSTYTENQNFHFQTVYTRVHVSVSGQAENPQSDSFLVERLESCGSTRATGHRGNCRCGSSLVTVRTEQSSACRSTKQM